MLHITPVHNLLHGHQDRPGSPSPQDTSMGIPGRPSLTVQARLHPCAGHLVHAGGALWQNHSGVA